MQNAFDPQANVEGGTRYLRELLERYDFDLIKALAAYNAGPQRVEQYGGVPPYYETKAYVARIVRDFNKKKLAAKTAPQPCGSEEFGGKSRRNPGTPAQSRARLVSTQAKLPQARHSAASQQSTRSAGISCFMAEILPSARFDPPPPHSFTLGVPFPLRVARSRREAAPLHG